MRRWAGFEQCDFPAWPEVKPGEGLFEGSCELESRVTPGLLEKVEKPRGSRVCFMKSARRSCLQT